MVKFEKLAQWRVWKYKYGPIPNKCLKIWFIFKQMFGNAVHFQTNVWKYGSCSNTFWNIRGNFSKCVWKWTVLSNICLKMDHIWVILFQNRHWASFSKFHHLAGDASYQAPPSKGLLGQLCQEHRGGLIPVDPALLAAAAARTQASACLGHSKKQLSKETQCYTHEW